MSCNHTTTENGDQMYCCGVFRDEKRGKCWLYQASAERIKKYSTTHDDSRLLLMVEDQDETVCMQKASSYLEHLLRTK